MMKSILKLLFLYIQMTRYQHTRTKKKAYYEENVPKKNNQK